MKSRAERSTQLLVVGAGPVGLLAALRASSHGIDVTLFDQFERGYSRGHATLLHPSSVRLLSELGLGAELAENGRPVTSLVLHCGDRKTTLRLPSPALSLSQGGLEEMLWRALERAGVEVCTPVEATVVQQDAAGVRVRAVRRELVALGSPNEREWRPVESFVVNARYVIGADGYESRVRSTLGIDSVSLGPTESFAMFECAAPASANGHLDIGFEETLATTCLPLAHGRLRIGFQLATELDAAPDAVRLRQLSCERAPWLAADSLGAVEWGAVTHFERRLVRRFGQNRVWLAGDAAHVTSPIGAQSMNVGLTEAADLVERIDACLRRDGCGDALRDYGLDCQREWYKLFGYHVKFELLPHAPPWLASHARRVAPVLPVSGDDRKALLDQLGLAIG